MYEIEYTLEAIEDLKSLRKYEQKLVVDGVNDQFCLNQPLKRAIERN